MAANKTKIEELVDETPEKEIAKVEETASDLAEIDMPVIEGIENMGFEELDSSDVAIRIPFVTLLQPTSQKVVSSRGALSAGDFILKNRDNEEICLKEIPVTIIAFTKDRTMWSENFKRGDSPICRSFDAKHMVSDGCGDGDCANCRFSKFDKDAKASACKSSYVLLCQNLETGDLFKVKASGASYQDVKEFIQKLYNTAKKTKTSSFCFQTILSSEFQTNDKGSYFILNLNPDKLSKNKTLYTGKTEKNPSGFDVEYLDFLKDTYTAYIDSLHFQNEKTMSEVTNVGSGDENVPF